MALLNVKVPPRVEWSERDQLRLKLGDETALNLTESDPAGGAIVATATPLEGAQRGGLDVGSLDKHPLDVGPYLFPLDTSHLDRRLDYGSLPDVLLEHAFSPVDVCAVVPFGVSIADAAGNVSDVFESFIGLSDHPRGARDVELTPNPPPREADHPDETNVGEALLSWSLSQDVELEAPA